MKIICKPGSLFCQSKCIIIGTKNKNKKIPNYYFFIDLLI